MRHLLLPLSSAVFLGVLSAPLFAQSNNLDQAAPRITQPVDSTRLAPLKSEVHPLVKQSVDLGPVDGALALDRMTLMLKRSAAQQQALDKLTADQQDKSSSNYHRWLTPEEFGARFGPAQSDIDQVTAWLQSEGFKIDTVANGRVFIEFSGNAAQVTNAFHTSIHNYSLNGEAHTANSAALAIPAALTPVVEGVRSLHDFRNKPLHIKVAGRVTGTIGDADSRPSFTFDVNNQQHGLAPADYDMIYSINTGQARGETIAVVGRSNINSTTLANFRALFSLTGGNNITVLNGPDPGILEQIGVSCTTQADCPERDEALLDNEWSSAIAPGATVKFVVSKSTNTEDGVNLSEMYIIDNNLADVMTESFGFCEAQSTQADADAISSLASQAAAQGITYVVSSGDSGSALCANPRTPAATGANATPSVNILASSPFTIAVGGTEFNEGCTIAADGFTLNCANYSQFWSASNAASNSETPFLSALNYIPENVWNEACPTTTVGSVTGCGATKANLFAGGGGASQFFPKPSWQKLAIPGIPAADHRYLPDVSYTAAVHDPYLVCLADTDCVPDATGRFLLHGIAGTSAAAPAFAGIMASVDQFAGARQGDAHAILYGLAVVPTGAQCDGSHQFNAPSGCFFNDVTVGNNAVPGTAGYGTPSASYQAAVGYDLATGLGSANGNNLVFKWAAGASTATTTLLTVSPSTLTRGTTAVLTATVTGTGGTPTGTLVFFEPTAGGTLAVVPLSGGMATFTTPYLDIGSYAIEANYEGDPTFVAGVSPPVNVAVTSTTDIAATAVFTTSTPTIPVGQDAMFHVVVSQPAGGATPTGSVGTFNSSQQAAPPVFATLRADGTADLTIHNLPVGQYFFNAIYAGDANYKLSSSNEVSVSVNTGGFVMAVNPASVTLASKGASGSAAVTLTATGVFMGTVALSCAMTPAAAPPPTCAVNPASVMVSGSGASTVSVLFGSIAPTVKPLGTQRASSTKSGWLTSGGIAFAGLLFFGFPRRRNWGAMLGLLLFAVISGAIGCGGGGSSITHTAGTTAGTYTATITGSSGTQFVNTTVTVVVP